jgi:hypothetical protein
MKRILLIILCLAYVVTFQAQVPQAFSYKVQIKGNSGNPHANKKINLKVSIIQDNVDGNEVYIEKHQVNTSPSGIVDIEIGRGTPLLGLFTEIDWKQWPYFIKAEVDLKCAGTFNLIAVTELLSVPFAMYAGNVANGFSGNYEDLLNKPKIKENLSEFFNDVGYINHENDPDPGNELQFISISNDTIYLSRGGFVKLPAQTNISGKFYYGDKDGDRYGDKLRALWVPLNTPVPVGYIETNSDCNDDNIDINPGAIEICSDGIDQDCDSIDLQCNPLNVDDDQDGYSENQGDFSDSNAEVYPGQTVYFSIPYLNSNNYLSFDYNCNGIVEKQINYIYGHTTVNEGWLNSVPGCGETGTYVVYDGVTVNYLTKSQKCH